MLTSAVPVRTPPYRRRKISNLRFSHGNVQKDLVFHPPTNQQTPHGLTRTSADEEEKKDFWRQLNNEFLAKKQDEMKKMTEQKKDTRTCFQCNTVGHIARDCFKDFDAEKAFNPKVKHIFGKMIDRKVKGVKEFYEKKRKGKKPSDGDSVTPKAGQAWVDIFFD
ncbi:putative transcription factor interactor and regulator CCHC(Zn) family [Helianthus annuus]|nr:putative transcription factor interactor and regulator CCHC(Zn) family [Helianthus annuus]